jgi:hypothetical protein
MQEWVGWGGSGSRHSPLVGGLLLLSKLKAPINHAESTLLQVLILKQLKVPLESITFEKQGGGYPIMVNQVLETSHPLSFPLRSDAKLASRMVLWDVLSPRRSRRSDVQTFGRVSDPSPLFSDPCGHSYTTATRQLLCNQFVTHSFHRDGEWGTPNGPTFQRANVSLQVALGEHLYGGPD